MLPEEMSKQLDVDTGGAVPGGLPTDLLSLWLLIG